MRITKIILGISVASCLVFSFAQAANQPATSADLEKLQDQVRVIDKDLSVLKETAASRLDAQDKRIGDISLNTAQHANHLAAIANQTTNVGNLISNTSIGITLLVFLASLITYFSATSRAEKEAQDASREWLKQNATRLNDEIEVLKIQAKEAQDQIAALRLQASTASSEISEHTGRVASNARAAEDKVASSVKAVEQLSANASRILESASAKDGSPPTKQDKEAIEVIKKASDALKTKPESTFTADDYYTRGVKYFADSEYQSALSAFRQATSQVGSSGPAEMVARFLFADAVTLGALGKSEEAIAVYDDIDRRFGRDEAPGMREQVARARNGLGFAKLMLAKACWQDEVQRQALLSTARLVCERALGNCAQNDRAIVLGNLGYSLFLAGEREAARAPTLECLKLGGQKQMALQTADAQQHRVEPEDSEYEQLLNELWRSLPPAGNTVPPDSV